MKLSVRIPLLFGLVVFVTSLAISLIASRVSSSILVKTLEDAMHAETDANSRIISYRLMGELDVINEIAMRARTRAMDWEAVQPTLAPDIGRYGMLDIAVITPDGSAHSVTANAVVANVADRGYFKQAMAGNKTIELSINRMDNTLSAMFAVPIVRDYSPNSPVLGVLMARKDGAKNLTEMLAMLKSSMETGRFFMVDGEGTFIGHPDMQMVLSQFNPIQEAARNPVHKSLAETVRRSLYEKEGTSNYIYEGNQRFGVFTEVEGFPWHLFLSMEQAEIDAEINQIRFATLGISAFFIIAGIIIAFAVGKSIAKPIREVSETLKDIAEGEGDLTHVIPVKSKDEIGDLALYFNETLEKIKFLVINIREDASALEDTGADLSSNMNETAAAINQITSNIQSIRARILNQSASVSETHATMENVTETISKLNSHIEAQSSNISKASAAIEQMVANTRSVTDTLVRNTGNVHVLKEAAGVGKAGLQGVAEDIKGIARESEGLLEINAVIKNIASQTNLLSMNAAIEAAHAGDTGKGFAVVADEIRKLAESSNEQSKIINTVLQNIKGSIDKIMAATEKVLSNFEAIDQSVKIVSEQEESIRAAMEEQGAGSRLILEGVSNVNEITSEVKAGSQEMLEGSREVIVESENLEKITHEITEGMNEMAKGAAEINEAVHHVNGISVKNHEKISLLMREVSRFKV